MKFLSNKQPEIDRLKQTLENNLRDFPINFFCSLACVKEENKCIEQCDWCKGSDKGLTKKIIKIKDVLNK